MCKSAAGSVVEATESAAAEEEHTQTADLEKLEAAVAVDVPAVAAAGMP